MDNSQLDIDKIVKHWTETSDDDYKAMLTLFHSRLYHWALFVGHISIEKLLKAYFVKKNQKHAPLFGSYTKGNPREDSDIDIAIIFSDYSNRLDRQVELMKLTREVDSRIEPHPFREKEFEISNPFVNEIVTYGKEIYL